MTQVNPSERSEVPASPGQSVTVEVAEHGPNLVLTVAGEVDLLTTPQLQQALTRAVEGRPPILVVDLDKVEFLASAGLAALVDAHQSAGNHTQVRIVATTTATLRPLQLTGLDTELAIYPSREASLTTE